jgi:type I restriction enzyme S subunit
MAWKSVILGDHCTITSSKRFHASERTTTGVPFYCSKEIIQKVHGEDVTECDYISDEAYENVKIEYGVPETGDLLITSRGTYGVPYLYRNSDKFYFADGNLTWLKDFDEELDAKYFFYWVQSYEGQQKIDAIAKGTAQKAIPISTLKTVELTIPDSTTQKKIASILSAYDDLIENNQKQIKLLEEAAQRLYKEWFVDLRFPGHENVKIVDGVPEGWRYGELQDIAIDAGKKEKKSNREEYSYYLPIDCLPRKSLAYDVTNDITCAESSLVGFKANDIIFGAMRPYFHKVVFARGKGLTRNTCFVINAKEPLFWAFLLLLMFSKDTIQYANQISVGTTMPYVRWQDFIHMPIIIPELRICKSFQRVIVNITKRISCLSDSCIKLQEARDRLLPKLISGEIQV